MQGVIPDPLVDNNWLNASNAALWNADGWAFSTKFTAPAGAGGHPPQQVQLVFDGIKMGCRAELNGKALGEMRSQFLRYSFAVGEHLLAGPGANVLTVTFDHSVDTYGRYMACAGSGDGVSAYTTALDVHSSLSGLNTSHTWSDAVLSSAVMHIELHIIVYKQLRRLVCPPHDKAKIRATAHGLGRRASPSRSTWP